MLRLCLTAVLALFSCTELVQAAFTPEISSDAAGVKILVSNVDYQRSSDLNVLDPDTVL